jgi:sulfate permease, SulP family
MFHSRHPIRRIAKGVKDFFGGEALSATPWIGPIKRYDKSKAKGDGRAALNVAVLAIPQGIAYAAIANLPLTFGILSSIVASIIAPFFAGSRHTILGPSNATAFMLFSFFASSPTLLAREVELIPLMVLMVGIFCLLGALLRAADLLQYISRSVLVGYIAGAAVLIISNQTTHVLGIYLSIETGRSFIGQLIAVCENITHSQWPHIFTSIITLTSYLFLKRWKQQWPCFAIILVISSAIFGTLSYHNIGGFGAMERFTTFSFAELTPKFPDFARPGIFGDISALIGLAFALAFLASLENTVMSKTLASRTGEQAQVNQDMLSVGIANIACAFSGGMPASGSLTRSALNESSGARTRFSSLLSGIYVLIATIIIALSPKWGLPLIDFVPKSALAALIIGLGFSLFNLKNIRICLRATPDDAAVLIGTFAA